MSLLISVFLEGREGSLGLALLVASLSEILFRMLSGRGMWCEFILPFGIWCLRAERIALVRMEFATWGSVGKGHLEKMSSIS